MRVVYFIASHVHPPQIERLVRTIRHGSAASRVFINHDYRVSYLDPAALADLDGVELAPEQRSMEWGWFSDVILQAMRWVESHYDYDWFLNISGQDYPVMPVAEIERCLATTPYDGFLGFHRHVDPARIMDGQDREFVRRYFYQYVPIPRLVRGLYLPAVAERVISRAARLLSEAQPLISFRPGYRGTQARIGIRALSPPFGASLHCYKGSNWWTFSRRAVRYVLDFLDTHPGLINYYARTFAPYESLFQTILFNAPGMNIARDTMRFIRWNEPSAHPEILRAADFEAMIGSGKYFARKIDSRVDPTLLDMLDEHVRLGAGSSW